MALKIAHSSFLKIQILGQHEIPSPNFDAKQYEPGNKLRENNPILQISRRRTKKQQPAYQTNLKCLDSNIEAGARLDSSDTILFYPAFENIAEATSTENTLWPKVPGGRF